MSAPFFKVNVGLELSKTLYLERPGDFDIPKEWITSTDPIKTTYRPLTIQYQNAGPEDSYPDYDEYGNTNLVSERLRRLVESLDVSALEFLPVTALDGRSRIVPIGPYWLVRTLERPDCIDKANSDLDLWRATMPDVRRIRRLVLDTEAVGLRHLFRPLGLWSLFASNELAQMLRAQRFMVRLRDAEEFTLP